MPIVAKSVLEARRVAAAQAAAAAQHSPVSPERGVTIVTPKQVTAADQQPREHEPELRPTPKPAKRRGHAVKDEHGKWQPTADYPEGFARTPEHSRFKPGCKGGPGRPKNSVSHDALLTKHLSQKREVSVNGRRQQLSARELLVMTTVKSAVEGKDRTARAYVLAQDQRLHPSRESSEDAGAPVLSASDRLSLLEYEAELREQLRAEIRAELEAEKGEGR